jgi:NAD(P)-dependent dehydrogenase (short-subunit alcohol dehydrogenase family)
MAARRIAIVTGGNRGIGKEIARQLLAAVNSMSPGWVRTDMPSNGPTGQFFRDRKPIPW